ncbi:PQQ-binding-like beta-propeller repeat protein [Candidatus Poribacteria bacterium]|nr:PQQ-binding-like beta-propeller repeat protein [Candidatus Poribacteria bacterium]
MKLIKILTSILYMIAINSGYALGDTADEIIKATGIKGGLIVHVGCGDGELTAAFGLNDGYLVQGLDDDPESIQEIRQHIHSLGLDGKVTAELWNGDKLPYIDNLVNLLIWEESLKAPMEEIFRVLCPDGAAYVKLRDNWLKFVKNRSSDIDEWTHFLHDSNGNPVSHDSTLGPPRHIQWVADPAWTRNHHKLNSISAVVSARGRIFYIADEATAASMLVPDKWFLTTRDAFNGVLLWKKPLESWAWHEQRFRSGPVQLPRTLVAFENRIYCPLGINEPLVALDAATGNLIRMYENTLGVEEIILHQGIILAVLGSPEAEQASIEKQRRGEDVSISSKTIKAINAESGTHLWKWLDSTESRLMPLTLAADGGSVFFQAGDNIICLNVKTGEKIWKVKASDAKGNKETRKIGWSVASLVIHNDKVFWSDGNVLKALSAKNGENIWQVEAHPGFLSPVDILVSQGLVWISPEYNIGRDLKTGEIKKELVNLDDLRTSGHHHRCYREKATDDYIIGGYRGMEFLSLSSDKHSRNNWVRGSCQYGILPANGLVYVPPHSCGCYMEAKLYGFWALAPEKEDPIYNFSTWDNKLEKGPAFGKVETPENDNNTPWPTYRHDIMRTGVTPESISPGISEKFIIDIGGRLTSPVIARGKMLVSSVDSHRIYAFDADTGKEIWNYIVGGRIDSPPTIHKGLVLFGSADGWIYCLRLSDGQLVWRFRAAPLDIKTVAFDQLESLWPVHGSILVKDGLAYAAAGRQSYIDGGIFLYCLNPYTGEVIHRKNIRHEHPETDDDTDSGEVQILTQNAVDAKTLNDPDLSDAFSMNGAKNDVLVSDGSSIFLRQLRFDRNLELQENKSRHLFSTSSLLDDTENHRSHWVIGTGDFSRLPVAYSWIANSLKGGFGYHLAVPYGLMLSFDDNAVWGIRRIKNYEYMVFAESHKPFSDDEKSLPDFRKYDKDYSPEFKWTEHLSIRPRAILKAGENLFIGGMPKDINEHDPHASYEGRKGGIMWIISANDGQQIGEYKLESPPVWDGMAAAYKHIYISLQNGKILCLGK